MPKYLKAIIVIVFCTGLASLGAWTLLQPRSNDSIVVGPAGGIEIAEAGQIVARARELNSGALLVVQHDEEVLGWGDIDTAFDIRSMRKSIINLILGRLVLAGKLELSASLADLDIDDSDFSLSEKERQATVLDLMEARSGVYHEAAWELPSVSEYRPSRGEHQTGSFWFYNNWDFNVLETIAAKSAGDQDYCQTFARLAAPLLDVSDPQSRCSVRLEPEKSTHPAHPLQLTPRELAKFARIYLNDGAFEGERILPEGWVKWSTQPVSDFHFIPDSRFNYGRLFWSIDPWGPFQQPTYMARGAGSQYLWLIPESNMAVIHTVRTWPLLLRKRLGLIPDDNEAWQFGGVVASAVINDALEAPPLY